MQSERMTEDFWGHRMWKSNSRFLILRFATCLQNLLLKGSAVYGAALTKQTQCGTAAAKHFKIKNTKFIKKYHIMIKKSLIFLITLPLFI